VRAINELTELETEREATKGEQRGRGLSLSSGDEDITTSDTTTPSIEVRGPITKSRVQQLRR
jgi:hypothetical protein